VIDLERLESIAAISKDVLTTAGIIAAGVWAFYVFGKTEAPNYSPQLSIGLKVSFLTTAADENCVIVARVTIENRKSTAVSVDDLKLRIWYFDFPSDAGDAGFFDVTSIQATEATWALPANADDALTAQYAPGTRYTYPYDFFGPRGTEAYIYALAEIATTPAEVGNETFASQRIENGCRTLT
jgi:hypothetical protein